MASDLGLNVNLATFRTLDPATGRWWQVDPKAEATMGMSPYGAMNGNPVSYVDPEGDLAWFVPVIIGAVIGGTTGGVIAHQNGQPWWKGAAIGTIIGAGVGLGVSAGLSAAGANITGIYTAGLQSTTLGWNITSNALLTSNINMASSLLQGSEVDGILSSGVVGLAAGGIGGGVGGSFDDVGFGASSKFFSNKAINATNLITGGLNGFGDRYVSSILAGESRKQSLINGFFGLGEGLYFSHFLGNKLGDLKGSYNGKMYSGLAGRYLSSAITQGGTSVPGLSWSIATWHATIAAGIFSYGGNGGSGTSRGARLATWFGTQSGLGIPFWSFALGIDNYSSAVITPFGPRRWFR